MGQEHPGALNCGLFERDNKTEVRGDQAMLIRKRLEQEKARFEAPSRDTDPKSVVTGSPKKSLNRPPRPQPELRTLQQIQHENVLKLSKDPFDRSIRCEFGFYEQADMSLASLIQSRYNTKLLFPEEQVLKLLESILYAAAFFERKGLKHHDIYPTNVFYVNGAFKLSHPKLTHSSYSLTIQRKRFSFLSPEGILDLRDEIEQPDEQTSRKSDVFSLGMVMLQFCTLKPSCECYDQDNYDIIDDRIQERLEMCRQNYSPKVAEVIQLMLEYEMDKRMGIFDLAKFVNQYAAEYNLTKRMAMNQQSQMVLKQGQPAGQVIQGMPGGVPTPGVPPMQQMPPQSAPVLSVPQGQPQNQAQIMMQLQQLQQQQIQQLMQQQGPVVHLNQRPPQQPQASAAQFPPQLSAPSSTSLPPPQQATVLTSKSDRQANLPPHPSSAQTVTPKRPVSPSPVDEPTQSPRQLQPTTAITNTTTSTNTTTNIQPPLSFAKQSSPYNRSSPYTLTEKDRPPSKVLTSEKPVSENSLGTYATAYTSSYTKNIATTLPDIFPASFPESSFKPDAYSFKTSSQTPSADLPLGNIYSYSKSSKPDYELPSSYKSPLSKFDSDPYKPQSTSTKSSEFASLTRKGQEQSLDDRVRRILEKSKQIK